MNCQPLEKLIPGLIPLIHSVARRYLDNPVDLEDLTQDVLIKLVASIRKQTLRSSGAKAWICATTRNAAIDALRDLLRRRSHEDASATARLNSLAESDKPPFQIAAREDKPENVDLRDRLPEILSHLPESQRSALLMCSAGASYEEIAAVQGVNLGTVRSRIHYARAKAQPLLEAYR